MEEVVQEEKEEEEEEEEAGIDAGSIRTMTMFTSNLISGIIGASFTGAVGGAVVAVKKIQAYKKNKNNRVEHHQSKEIN